MDKIKKKYFRIFFSTFQKITVGGFVYQIIKKILVLAGHRSTMQKVPKSHELDSKIIMACSFRPFQITDTKKMKFSNG